MLLIALIALMSLTHSVEGGLFCKKGSATISFYDKELDKTYKVKVKDLLGKNKDAFDSVTKMTVYPNGDKSDHFDMLKIVVDGEPFYFHVENGEFKPSSEASFDEYSRCDYIN